MATFEFNTGSGASSFSNVRSSTSVDDRFAQNSSSIPDGDTHSFLAVNNTNATVLFTIPALSSNGGNIEVTYFDTSSRNLMLHTLDSSLTVKILAGENIEFNIENTHTANLNVDIEADAFMVSHGGAGAVISNNNPNTQANKLYWTRIA